MSESSASSSKRLKKSASALACSRPPSRRSFRLTWLAASRMSMASSAAERQGTAQDNSSGSSGGAGFERAGRAVQAMGAIAACRQRQRLLQSISGHPLTFVEDGCQVRCFFVAQSRHGGGLHPVSGGENSLRCRDCTGHRRRPQEGGRGRKLGAHDVPFSQRRRTLCQSVCAAIFV